MIAATDAITLQAFALALPKLDQELPANLHHAIQQTGDLLAHNQSESAAQQVRELVKQHDRLHTIYQAEYDQIQKQTQNRTKSATWSINSSTVNSSTVNSRTFTFTWENSVATILNANDFGTTAKDLLNRVKPRITQTSEETRLFLKALSKNVAAIDAESIRVLRCIEQQLLTVEDAAYMVDLPVQQTIHIVQKLQNEGYVYPQGHHPLSKLFASFRATLQLPAVTSDSTFNLTNKGYWHLHPFIKPRKREETTW